MKSQLRIMPRTNQRKVQVVKLSGSLFFSSQFESIVKILRSAVRRRSKALVLVSGGGVTARRYIRAGSELNADQSSLDEIGIAISRLNATVLREALGKFAFSTVPQSLSEVADALEIGSSKGTQRIVVCGGLHPGQSTNAVAALVAEKIRATRLINATDVDAVYDKDPRKFKNAKKLHLVSAQKLAEMLDSESVQAGAYDLMDPIALKIIARSKIPTWILKCDPKILESALAGRGLHGTRITV